MSLLGPHRLRFAALILLGALALDAAASVSQRVLVIHSFGRDIEPYGAIESAFRTSLASGASQPVAIHEVTLDAGNGDPLFDEQLLVDHLRDRFRSAGPDVVVTLGPPAARFYTSHRARLFPDKPYVMAALESRVAPTASLGRGDAAVMASIDFPQLVERMAGLLPQLRTLAVVVGDSPVERFWTEQLRKEFAQFEPRLNLEWLAGLSLDETRRRVADLPPRSAVFYASLRIDGAGVPYARQRALAVLNEATTAPIFGLYETELGNGVVGGPYLSQRRRGELAAAEVLRALRGERGAGPTLIRTAFEPPVYDWRELQRWKIDPARLPADAEVRFRQPSLWAQHGEELAGLGVAIALQFALIGGLVVQRGRARRAELEARNLGGQLITAHEDERRRIARELHDDVTQRLARLSIDAARIEQHPADANVEARALREQIVSLSEDVHALSHQLHPAVLEDLGLPEALKAEGERLVRHEAIACKVDTGAVPAALPKDVALCLFRVAQEAMRNVARHARASSIDISLAPKGDGLQLRIADDGQGFEPGRGDGQARLGLASMQERVRLVRGTIAVDSEPGKGTTVLAWVPLRGAA